MATPTRLRAFRPCPGFLGQTDPASPMGRNATPRATLEYRHIRPLRAAARATVPHCRIIRGAPGRPHSRPPGPHARPACTASARPPETPVLARQGTHDCQPLTPRTPAHHTLDTHPLPPRLESPPTPPPGTLGRLYLPAVRPSPDATVAPSARSPPCRQTPLRVTFPCPRSPRPPPTSQDPPDHPTVTHLTPATPARRSRTPARSYRPPRGSEFPAAAPPALPVPCPQPYQPVPSPG